jgi:UDP-glucose 4-epimerase
MENRKTILISGGAAYIGSIVAELLEKRGHKIIVIDDLGERKKEAVSPNSIFYQSKMGKI